MEFKVSYADRSDTALHRINRNIMEFKGSTNSQQWRSDVQN